MRRVRIVAWGIGACTLIVGAIALSVPAENWRDWWYGGTHDFELCGVEFSASGIVLCVDGSGSSLEGFELAKRVFPESLEDAPDHIEFGCVFFDGAVRMYPADGKVAGTTDENRAAMSTWLQSVRSGSSSCIKKGLQAALDMAKSGRASRKIIIYIGDGGGTCLGSNERTYLEQTLEQITTNAGEVAISVINTRKSLTYNAFIESLATATGGQYVRLHPSP